MGFLILLITIISISALYFWVNKNDRGRYVALATIIVLLIISSITIYKYQKTKSALHQVMYNNYNEFVSVLNINYLGDSKSEENEYFKNKIGILVNRAIEFDTIGEITPMSSFFTTKSLKETFPELKEIIYSIYYKIREEDHSLEEEMIEDLSKHLSEIGFMLGTRTGSVGHNNFGILRPNINYKEIRIQRVEELVEEINKILEE